MAMTFIWKKQLVMFVTMFIVVLLGLIIGGFLHDRFGVDPRATKQPVPKQVQTSQSTSDNSSDSSAVQTPFLSSFPTTKPGTSTPPKSPVKK
ncbi:MAG: hypothetical protein WC101_00245 [Candidatus Gracilibacteria bacterium]